MTTQTIDLEECTQVRVRLEAGTAFLFVAEHARLGFCPHASLPKGLSLCNTSQISIATC